MEFEPEDLGHAIAGLLKEVQKAKVEIHWWRQDEKLIETLYRMQKQLTRAIELAEHLQKKVP